MVNPLQICLVGHKGSGSYADEYAVHLSNGKTVCMTEKEIRVATAELRKLRNLETINHEHEKRKSTYGTT